MHVQFIDCHYVCVVTGTKEGLSSFFHVQGFIYTKEFVRRFRKLYFLSFKELRFLLSNPIYLVKRKSKILGLVAPTKLGSFYI